MIYRTLVTPNLEITVLDPDHEDAPPVYEGHPGDAFIEITPGIYPAVFTYEANPEPMVLIVLGGESFAVTVFTPRTTIIEFDDLDEES